MKNTLTETSATKKTIHNPDVEKLMEELNGKDGADVALDKYEMLLAKAKKLSEKLGNSAILEKDVISVGEKLIRIGADRDEDRNIRISSLETALKLLFDFYGKQKNNPSISLAVLVLIAKACYERSVLILSKQDKVMVEKKKRIIKKGIEFANKAVAKESNNKDALRLRSILLLELEKIDKDDLDVAELKKALSSAIQNGCTEFDKNADDIEIAIRLAEFAKNEGGGKPLPKDVCKSLEDIVASSLQTKDIELKKAKAHFLLGNKEDDEKIIECMKIFAKKLESLSFSDTRWREASGFVRELEKAGKDCWKEIALLVWEACKKRYEESKSVEHYWYFGHLMSHYYIADLAFAAQDDIEKKVEIADFLKSKILLHGQALDDEAERFWEYNKDVRQQRFIKRMEMVYETEKKRTSGANRGGFKEIPQDYVVIHFYLNKLERKGYAILAYSDSEWKIKKFPYEASLKITAQTAKTLRDKGASFEIVTGLEGLVGEWYATEEELIRDLKVKIGVENTTRLKEVILENILRMNLFEAFISWQTNYYQMYNFVNDLDIMQLYRINAAKYLVKLCKEIGNAMPFLFDIYDIPLSKHILFISHDFLNRLPLHGALGKDNNIFLQNHASCSYLPSWSLAPQNEGKGQEDSEKQIEKRLLKYFEEHDYDELKKDVVWNSQEDPATPEHLLNGYMPPGILTILSHGMADVVNSFNAKLMLNGGDVTNFDIMKHPSLRFDGSHVILGCCEGDLLPPLAAALDEHLSIASAFLFKGATEVLCTMWEANPEEQVEEIAIKLCNCKDNLNIGINIWQKEMLVSWQEPFEPMVLYDTLVFRRLGGLL